MEAIELVEVYLDYVHFISIMPPVHEGPKTDNEDARHPRNKNAVSRLGCIQQSER